MQSGAAKISIPLNNPDVKWLLLTNISFLFISGRLKSGWSTALAFKIRIDQAILALGFAIDIPGTLFHQLEVLGDSGLHGGTLLWLPLFEGKCPKLDEEDLALLMEDFLLPLRRGQGGVLSAAKEAP